MSIVRLSFIFWTTTQANETVSFTTLTALRVAFWVSSFSQLTIARIAWLTTSGYKHLIKDI